MSDIQPNLPQLVEELQSITATWRLFGLFLGIPKEELEAIDVDKKNVGDKLYVLCCKWLEMKPRGTWNDIVKALKKIQTLELAERLEKKYIIHHLPPNPKEVVNVDVKTHHRPTFHQLYEELHHVRAEWEQFGIWLRLAPGDLAVITREKSGVDQSFAAVCDEWLKRNPSGTWEDIIIALEKMKRFNLKTELEKKYIKHHLPSSDTLHDRSDQISTSPSLPHSLNPTLKFPQPLIMAVFMGNVSTLDEMLQSKADPDVQFHNGSTALHIASYEGRHQCVDLLLKSNANPNIQNNYGATALHIVGNQHGHHQCVILLLKSNVNPDIQDRNGGTALHIASELGYHKRVDLLLKSKANPDIQTNDGRTALYLASQYGHDQCVELLLQSKANPDIQENDGLTALYVASQKGHDQCVELLLQSKANPDIQENDGCTALYIASQEGHDQCVELLLQSKANPNIATKKGGTPLLIAILFKHPHFASILLKHNANPNTGLFSPLSTACCHGDLSLVSLLLQYGALVNTPDPISTLTEAVKRGFYDIAKSLINAGANVNIQEQYVTPCGITPLMIASTHGNLPMVQLLLQSGADVMIQDKEGYTAYDAAKAYQHQKIITLLTIKIYEQAQKYSLRSEEPHESASSQQHQDNDERQTQERSLETIQNHFNGIMSDKVANRS